MSDNKYVKFIGQVVENNGGYIFKADSGEKFFLMNSDENRRLADSHELCMIDVPLLKDGSNALYGNISAIYGRGSDPIARGKAIADKYNLQRVYSQAVLDEIKKMSLTISNDEYDKKLDFRHSNSITVDPKFCGDHDDSITIIKNPDGSITFINEIADLDSTIKMNSSLFEHASNICNSAYLGLMVYPMLHEKISNDKNSLNEGVDKEVACIIGTIAPNGDILDYAICKAIINVKKRLTYEEVDYLLFGENCVGDTEDHSHLKDTISPEVMETLKTGYEYACLLKEKRRLNGALIISDRAVEFNIDRDTHKVTGYRPAYYAKSMDIIAEFAVISNMIWCQVAKNLQIPIMYRNHDSITKENEIALSFALKEFGITLPHNPKGRDLQKKIDENKNKRLGKIVESTILKALGHAYYSNENNGHVGVGVDASRYSKPKNNDGIALTKDEILNNSKSLFNEKYGKNCGVAFTGNIDYSEYGHLTAPIRRFGDIINHKNTFSYIRDGKILFDEDEIGVYADRCTNMEILTEKAEREYQRMLAGMWASEHVGEVLDGIVVSLGKSSMTVMTDDNLIFHLPYANLSNGELARNLAHPRKGEKRRMRLGTLISGVIECVRDDRIIVSQKLMDTYNKKKSNTNNVTERETSENEKSM